MQSVSQSGEGEVLDKARLELLGPLARAAPATHLERRPFFAKGSNGKSLASFLLSLRISEFLPLSINRYRRWLLATVACIYGNRQGERRGCHD